MLKFIWTELSVPERWHKRQLDKAILLVNFPTRLMGSLSLEGVARILGVV